MNPVELNWVFLGVYETVLALAYSSIFYSVSVYGSFITVLFSSLIFVQIKFK